MSVGPFVFPSGRHSGGNADFKLMLVCFADKLGECFDNGVMNWAEF